MTLLYCPEPAKADVTADATADVRADVTWNAGAAATANRMDNSQHIDPSSASSFDTFPPIEAIIPHRGTMLLLDAVTAFGDESIEATAHVRRDAWYADANGAMPAWIGVELMAQAIAAHVGLLAIRAGRTALPGVLLGSQRYRAIVPAFAAGARLAITAHELLRTDEGTAAYQCTIACVPEARATGAGAKGNGGIQSSQSPGDSDSDSDGNAASPREPLAEAIIKAFQPRDFQSFIEGSFRS